MVAVQSHAAHHPSTLSQYGALGCLGAAGEILPAAKRHYQDARDAAVARLKRLSGFPFVTPQGAFYVFLSVQDPVASGAKAATSLALSEYLLEEWNLATVPGEGFGRGGFLRLSFANSLNYLEMALDRLERGLGAFLAS
jgi:aspartate/methionine/tyrosine aminotransferase